MCISVCSCVCLNVVDFLRVIYSHFDCEFFSRLSSIGNEQLYSSNFTAICWATSEVAHHFDNNGFRSPETLNYIISSGI